MGATVQAEGKKYTDLSGKFFEKMTIKYMEDNPSLFNNDDYETFRRIDADKNDELSKDEITSELYNDINSLRETVRSTSGAGAILGILCFINSKSPKKYVRTIGKIGFGITLFDLFRAICSKIQLNKMEQRISQGYN